MPYRPSESAYALDPFGMAQPPDPLTEEDVALAQRRLERVGLGDSMLGKANDWRGRMVAKRDGLLDSKGPDTQPAAPSANSSALKDGAKAAVNSGLLSSL